MPRMPRDISGRKLTKLLEQYGYQLEREKGSHIRFISTYKGTEHKITIPDHDNLKIGTLSNILKDISAYLSIDKEALVKSLFNK